jgi:hypothetical protein
VLDWCYMCKRNGESIDHLLLHCLVARELWNLAFSMFGVDWVMPRSVMGLLLCWPRLSKRANGIIRGMIPHCIMWSLWRERNSRSFEGREKPLLDLKQSVLNTLLEWAAAMGLIPCYSLIFAPLLCNFVSSIVHTLCTWY